MSLSLDQCQSTYSHWLVVYLLLPAMKLGQGNIFSGVCQEFCSQEGSALLHAGIPPGKGDPTGKGDPPHYSACWERYGQQVGGTHPTGMHTCLCNFLAGSPDQYL